MNVPPPRLSGPQPGLLARVVMTILGAIMLVSAAFLGAVVFLVALGIFAVLAVLMGYRVWRLKRQFEKAAREAGGTPGGSGRNQGASGTRTSLEGDYVVVDRPGPDDPGDSASRK
ncbi:MAG: hypothetical protein P8080_02845 [Gammaproteobacteria bacterium]